MSKLRRGLQRVKIQGTLDNNNLVVVTVERFKNGTSSLFFIMSRTKTFMDYVSFLERLIDKDPLFLKHAPHIKLQKYDSPEEEDSQITVPQSNMLYLVGGNSQSFIEVVDTLGLRKTAEKEQDVSYEGSRHPHPPRRQYVWKVNDNSTHASMTFETGDNPRRMKFLFSEEENFHHESEWISDDYVDDGELDVHTLSIVTSYVATPELKRQLESSINLYDLDEVIDFHGKEMKVGELIKRYGVNYDTRASVDLTIRIMKEMMRREVPAIFSQANQPRIIAVNEVPLQY